MAKKKSISEVAQERLDRLRGTGRAIPYRTEPLAGQRELIQDDIYYRRTVIPTPGAKPFKKSLLTRLTTREAPRSRVDIDEAHLVILRRGGK